MKTKSFKKRLLAGALSAVMALSLAAGLLPGGGLVRTVEAAGGVADDYDDIMQHDTYDGNGQIVIQMLDSSVPGADKETKGDHRDLNKSFTDAGITGMWPDAAVSDTMHLLPIGEGLARMDGRPVVAYDVTDLLSSGANGAAVWSAAAKTWCAKEYGSDSQDMLDSLRVRIGDNQKIPYIKVNRCLEPASKAGVVKKYSEVKYEVKHTLDGRSYMVITKDLNDWLTYDHRYIFVEERNLNNTYYGYIPNVEGKEPDETKDKGWQLYVGWDTAADGKNPNVHVTYNKDGNGLWHVDANNGAAEIGMSDKTQPLHNEVMRGGFSFHVANIETGTFDSKAGAGRMEDSVFAVFNINSTALPAYAYESNKEDPKQLPMPKSTELSDPKKGYGYVTVDANGDGVVGYMGKNGSTVPDAIEAVTCFPAYTKNDVLAAWREYLQNSAKAANDADLSSKMVNGAYGNTVSVGGKTYDYTIKNIGTNKGLFVMGKSTDNRPIVPCLVLKSDANGLVSTPGAYALPAGNYLVLQIKAGDGMYVDENFQPIVSIGPWYTGNDALLGYGNTAFGNIGTSLATSETVAKTAKSYVGKEETYGWPVAYVRANTGSVIDLSNLSANGNFPFVTKNGSVQTSGAVSTDENKPTYTNEKSLLKKGDWNVNMHQGNPTTKTSLAEGVGARRIPKTGYSRFTAYQTPVRGGTRFYIGDAEDVSGLIASGSVPANYIAEPQGDGSFVGATFRLYNNRPDAVMDAIFPKTGNGFKAPSSSMAGIDLVTDFTGVKPSQKKLLTWGTADYQDYTVYKEAGTGKYYLEIPVDELPFGAYTMKQVLTGPGYGSWSGHEDPDWSAMKDEDITIGWVSVRHENAVNVVYDSDYIGRGDDIKADTDTAARLNEVLAKYTMGATVDADGKVTGGTLYLPQTIVTGGYTVDVTGDESFAADSVKVDVKIFNISEHYVYVDKDGDGAKEKYPTSKSAYDLNVKGRAMTVDQVALETSKWQSCVAELTDMSIGETRQKIEQLPYGTYMIAVTACTEGYTPVTSVVTTDKISFEGDEIQYTVKILDKSRIPVMATTLLDNGYQLDSIPWKQGVTITDVVDLGNLQDGVSYTAYGMLVDQLTGAMVPGSSVAVAENITGYVPPAGGDTGTGGNTGGVMANLRDLIAKGETFSTGAFDSESYGIWIYNVQDYAKTSSDSMLPSLVNSAVNNYNNHATTSTFIERYHLPVMARMKYIAGDAGNTGNGADLTGRQTVRLYYNNIDVRNDRNKAADMEGRSLVSVVILCEGRKQPDALLATDLGGLMALTNSTSVCIKNDLGDEEETVHAAALDITATGSYTGGKVLDPSESVLASVSYGNIEIGNDYILTVKLRDGNGAWVLDEENKAVEKTTGVFRATLETGKFDAVFDDVDIAKYNGQRLTAFATLERVETNGQLQNRYWLIEKGDAATMGYTAGDKDPGKNQVDVNAPLVKTVLADRYGNKEVDFDNRVTLVDTVDYTMLTAGETYESVMTLVDSTGVTLKDDAGNDLIVKKTFTVPADNKDGKFRVQLEATFDGTTLLGQEIVSYNDLYHITPDKKAHVAEEHELSSKDQTVKAVGESVRTFFTTVARDDNSRTHYVTAGSDVSVTDVVTLRNMTPGEKYVLKTEIASANTSKVLNQVEPVFTQVTADNDGDIKAEVKISLNTNVFKGQTLVVYQTLYDAKEKEIIEEHTSNTDPNQMLYVADIDTVATGENGRSKRIHPDLIENEEVSSSTVNGEHKVNVTKSYSYETTIMDRVYFSNLVAGNEYKITTEVVTRKGAKSVASTSQNYTPTSSGGSFTAYIDLDVTDYLGEELVVYETITDVYSNQVVAVHKDIDDEDQTVEIMASAEDEEDEKDPDEDEAKDEDKDGPNDGKDDPNTGKNIQTGVAEHYRLFFILAAILLAVAGGAGYWYYRKRR